MHYYTQTGQPMHFVPKKDGSGSRPATIADALKLNLLPGVTTVLSVLNKPALQTWIARQNVLAVCTAPDRPGESLDDKITRILEVDREQDREAAQAADLGTRIHDALEARLQGREVDPDLLPWIEPAVLMLSRLGQVAATEVVLVGDGYAGKADLILQCADSLAGIIVDFKTTKKLPEKGSWTEHRLQLAAYAAARANNFGIITANCYISTVDKGAFVFHYNPPWQTDYDEGFAPLLQYWQWANQYRPLRTSLPDIQPIKTWLIDPEHLSSPVATGGT